MEMTEENVDILFQLWVRGLSASRMGLALDEDESVIEEYLQEAAYRAVSGKKNLVTKK